MTAPAPLERADVERDRAWEHLTHAETRPDAEWRERHLAFAQVHASLQLGELLRELLHMATITSESGS